MARVESRLHRHRFGLLWLGCAAVVATMWLRVYAFGEMPYFLGDFLINYAAGPVRRGLSGEIALALASWIGGGTVVWGLVLASAACVALFAAAIRFYRAMPDDPALLPLILAPFGLLFLAYDPDGALRKEAFGHLALLAVLLAAVGASVRAARWWSLLGAAGFPVAIFAHEAVLFLWPALAVGFWLVAHRHRTLRRRCAWLGAATLAGGVLAAGWLAALPAPDIGVICAAVGLVPCGGAIGWLEADLGRGVNYVIGRRRWVDLAVFAAYAGLCLLPFRGLRRTGLPVWVVAAGLLAVVPLFVIGFDWGRWIHMAVFPLSLLVLAAHRLGLAAWRRPFPPWGCAIYLGSWSLPHAVASHDLAALALWPGLALLVVAARLGTWRRGARPA